MRSYLQTVLVTGIRQSAALPVRHGGRPRQPGQPQPGRRRPSTASATSRSSRRRCSARRPSRSRARSSPTRSCSASSGIPTFYGMNAAPIAPGPDHRRHRHLGGRAPARRPASSTTAFMLLFGAVPSPLGFLAILVAVLGGARVRRPGDGVRRDPRAGHRPDRDADALRAAADDAVLRHVLPAVVDALVPAVDRLDLAALALAPSSLASSPTGSPEPLWLTIVARRSTWLRCSSCSGCGRAASRRGG